MGIDLMLLPMTYPSATGMTCVTPSPLSTTVPVIAPPFFCTSTAICHTGLIVYCSSAVLQQMHMKLRLSATLQAV